MTNENKTKPIVTDEMLQQASYAFLDANPAFQTVGYKEMRAALEAALAVQPKPQLTEYERARVKHLRNRDGICGYEWREVLTFIDRLTGNETK